MLTEKHPKPSFFINTNTVISWYIEIGPSYSLISLICHHLVLIGNSLGVVIELIGWGYIYFRSWKTIIKKSRGHCDVPQKNNRCWSQTLKFRRFACLVTIRILVWLQTDLHILQIYPEFLGLSFTVCLRSLAWLLIKLLLIFHKKSPHYGHT